MRLKANNIFLIVVSATILHFIFATIAGNYIARQVGSLAGDVISKGLIEASEEAGSSGKDANEIYRNMVAKNEAELSKWKIPSFLISLPIKPSLNPLIKKIRTAWINEPVHSGEISFEQVKKRGRTIDNIANGLNSISFGIIIYLIYGLMMKVRRR